MRRLKGYRRLSATSFQRPKRCRRISAQLRLWTDRLDIYARQPERLMEMMAKNCKDRRLERGYSRRTLAERTGVPAPTIERFERTGKIFLESFCAIAVEFDYFQEMSEILSNPKYTTGSELETINRNENRIKGR